MAFPNKFAVKCSVCQARVEQGQGWTEGPPWVTKCQPCSGKAEEKAIKPTIKLLLDAGSDATINPSGFLGGDLFAAFRRSIEGSRFDGERRLNVASLDKIPTIIANLKGEGFVVDVDPQLSATIQALTSQLKLDVQGADERADKVDAKLRERGLFLFPFQREGIKKLAGRHAYLLADEMGLGKTIQALVSSPEGSPVVVISPSVAKGVWAREIAKWRPDLTVTLLKGRDSFRWPAPSEMVALNYDILSTEERVKTLGEVPEGVVLIADEAHLLKESTAQRTVRFRFLSEAVRARKGRVWLLTATPMLNRPPELWNVLQAAGLARSAFGTWKQFVEIFNGVQGKFGGWEWGTPREDVAERLRRVSLRRLRKEVLPELPTKTWQEIPVELDAKTKRICDRLLKNPKILEAISKSQANRDALASFEELSAARAALATAKIPAMLSIVETFEDQQEPLVVFSAHLAPIQALADRPGWAIITGNTSPEERTRIEDAFQGGKLRGVAATIQAGGVAITLTKSANALFVDRMWTPELNAQAEDRICRIGQDRGCIIRDLVANHAIDERVYELLVEKKAIINASVGASSVKNADVELVELDLDALAAEAKTEAELADRAKAEAEQRAKEREEHFKQEREEADKERAEDKKKRKEEASRERAKNRGWVEAENHPERRAPESAQERWAQEALQTLSALDPDYAEKINGVGFSKSDGYVGHWLSLEAQRGLTPKQWKLAINVCRKYHRQVGACPESPCG